MISWTNLIFLNNKDSLLRVFTLKLILQCLMILNSLFLLRLYAVLKYK